MRIHDVLTESDLQQIDEAPAGMGMFGRAGRKIASKLGHSKSTGVLDAGNDAIALRKELNRYLGKTGQQPNSEALIGFLTSTGYPTQGVMKIIQAHGGTPTGVLGKGSSNMSAFKDRMGMNKPAAGETPPKIEPTGTIEVPPAGDKPAADGATDAPAGFAPKTNVTTTTTTGEPIPTGGIPNTSMDPLDAIKKNAGIPAAPAADTPAAKAAPSPKMDPEQAAALKDKLKNKQGIGATSTTGFKTAKADADAKGIKNFESFDLDEEEAAAKVLPNSVIDQALLRAVQDSYKLGGGQNINTGASGTTPGADDEKPGAMSRFGSNFKAGMSGQTGGAAAGGADKAASADVANTLKTAAGGQPVQSTTNQGIDTLLKNAGLLK